MIRSVQYIQSRLETEIILLRKLVNSNVGCESSLPVNAPLLSYLSYLSTTRARRLVWTQQEMSSLNLHLSLQA